MKGWLTAEKEYQGLPLLLRRPAEFPSENLRFTFSELLVVTHKFSGHLADGLPDTEYNRGLANLDHDILSAFDNSDTGTPILAETFGGERNYYFYVKANSNVPNIVGDILKRYPHEKLTMSIESDPDWIFLNKYRKDYLE